MLGLYGFIPANNKWLPLIPSKWQWRLRVVICGELQQLGFLPGETSRSCGWLRMTMDDYGLFQLHWNSPNVIKTASSLDAERRPSFFQPHSAQSASAALCQSPDSVAWIWVATHQLAESWPNSERLGEACSHQPSFNTVHAGHVSFRFNVIISLSLRQYVDGNCLQMCMLILRHTIYQQIYTFILYT